MIGRESLAGWITQTGSAQRSGTVVFHLICFFQVYLPLFYPLPAQA